MKFLILLMSVLPALAWSAPVDRTAMVEAVARAMPVLLKFSSQHQKYKELPAPERAAYVAAFKTFRTGVTLDFNENASEFHSTENETQRLMRTGELQTDPIHINLEMLNAQSSEITLPILAQIFFHEAARKNTEIPLVTFDRAARVFASIIESYTNHVEIADGHSLHILSIPAYLLHKNLVSNRSDEFQPTYLLLWERPDGVQDLTPLLNEKINLLLPSVRGIWTSILQPILVQLSVGLGQFMKMAGELMQRFGQSVGLPFNPTDIQTLLDKLSLNFDFEEVRRFDMHGVNVLNVDKNSAFIAIRSQMHISRADELQLPPGLEGIADLNNFDAPVSIQLALPLQDSQSPSIHAMTTIQSSAEKEVKVQSVVRSGDWPSQIKLRFESKKVPRIAQLVVDYPTGSLAIAATSMELDSKGNVNAVFEIPASLQSAHVPLTATALSINYKTLFYLNRFIEIKDGTADLNVEPANNSIVDGKTGYWGQVEDDPQLITDFNMQHAAAAFLDLTAAEVRNVKTKDPKGPQTLFSPTNMHLQFELAHPEENIRAIRMTFMRQFSVAHKIKNDEAIIKDVEGEKIKWVFSADGAESKAIYEDVTIAGDQIKWDADNKTGHVHFQLPFEKLRELKYGEGYMAPMGAPIGIEVITQDFRSIHYRFPKRPIDPCEVDLNFSGGADFEVRTTGSH